MSAQGLSKQSKKKMITFAVIAVAVSSVRYGSPKTEPIREPMRTCILKNRPPVSLMPGKS